MSTNVQYVFDATQHQPDAGRDPVPAGTYNVAVDTTEVADMANDESGQSKGWMLKVHYKITDGEFKDRIVSNNYNLGHKTSPDNVRIAHGQLSALCHVTGVFKLDMTNQGAELRGRPLRILVTNDGQYNQLKGVFDVNGNKPSRAGSGAAPAQTAPVASATPGAGWGAQPAAAPVQTGWGATPATAAPPAAPTAPAAPAAPPAPAVFPPEGWTAHPSAPGYFYKDQEVLLEADLRARSAAPPAAPAAPAVPAGAWSQTAPQGAQPAAPWGAPGK